MALSNTGSDIYYLLEAVDKTAQWEDVHFEVSWDAPEDSIPFTSLPATLWTAPYPEALSLDWDEQEAWTAGSDLSITYVADAALVGAFVEPYVTDRYNTPLSNTFCVEDASQGELILRWDEVMADVDTTQAAYVYLKVSFYGEELIRLPHNRSQVWHRAFTEFWFVLAIEDPA